MCHSSQDAVTEAHTQPRHSADPLQQSLLPDCSDRVDFHDASTAAHSLDGEAATIPSKELAKRRTWLCREYSKTSGSDSVAGSYLHVVIQ